MHGRRTAVVGRTGRSSVRRAVIERSIPEKRIDFSRKKKTINTNRFDLQYVRRWQNSSPEEMSMPRNAVLGRVLFCLENIIREIPVFVVHPSQFTKLILNTPRAPV